MRFRPVITAYILILLLAACGCVKNAPVNAAEQTAVPETPVPLIQERSPEVTATPEPTPEPELTPVPDRRPITYAEDIDGLTVSEVLLSAKYVRLNGEAVPFLELYNGGTEPLSLNGISLSDRLDELEKFPLPDVTLEPGACLALPFDAADRPDGIPFGLSEKDDGLFLYRAEDRRAVKYSLPGSVERDVSVAPAAGGGVRYCAYATPGKKNAPVYETAGEAKNALLSGVYFNEVSAEGAGWIELKNGGTGAVSLKGWHWTDDPAEPEKETLSGQIGAGRETVFTPGTLRISASGETLYLYDADGFFRDRFSTGVLTDGMTSGRSGTGERVFYQQATPGSRNGSGMAAEYLPAPVFSETGLYQESPFALSIFCADPDAVIFYTVDGSEPTETGPRYEDPLQIEKSASVRAFARFPGGSRSEEASVHFIFGAVHTLPVVYIDMDPALFKRLTNVPFDQKGLIEQPCRVTYYEADGRLAVHSFAAGIKPRGNASISYPQKSLSIHLRKQYGENRVRYDFWGTGFDGPFEALVLRNSGQDAGGCHLRDAFAQRASADLRVDTQLTRPVVVYVDGEYYGVLDLNENLNKATLAQRAGTEKENINIVQRNDHVVNGSAEGFVTLRRYAMTKNFKDDAVVAEYAKKLDLGAVTDYIIAQSFFGNYDIHNQNYWSTADGQVSWRPFLYDVDRCLNAESIRSNVLSMYFNKAGIVHDRQGDRIWMDMYCALKQNEGWRTSFLNRCAYLLCNDYSTETLLELFDTMAEEIRPEMERHSARFGTPSSLNQWEKNVKDMRKKIEGRYGTFVKNIRSVFKLSEKEWEEIIAPYREGKAWEE